MTRTHLCLLLSLLAPFSVAVSCSSGSSTSAPASDAGGDSMPDVGADATEVMPDSASQEAGMDSSTGEDAPVLVDASGDVVDGSDAIAVDTGVPDSALEAGAPQPTPVVTDAPNATALLGDGTNLYWIDSIGVDGGTVGRVMKVPVGGGMETTLATTPGVPTERLVLDGANIYFTDGANTVWQVPKLGGAAATPLITSDEFAPLGALNGTVYFGASNGISEVTVGADSGVDAGTILTTTGGPVDMVAVAGDLFWANPVAGLIQYVAAGSGGTPTTLVGPDPEAGVGEFVSATLVQNLITDGTSLYWNRAPNDTYSGAIMAVPVGGGPPSVVVNTGSDMAYSVATDGTSIYYLDLGATVSLAKVAIGSNMPSIVTAVGVSSAGILGTPGPTIAVDSTNVYWLNPPQILRIAK